MPDRWHVPASDDGPDSKWGIVIFLVILGLIALLTVLDAPAANYGGWPTAQTQGR